MTADFKYTVTCSTRGCFYVWKTPKQVYTTIRFKAKQNEMMHYHPSLDNKHLTHIAEDEGEGSENEELNDIDEGPSQSPRNKNWKKMTKRKSQYPPDIDPVQFKKIEESKNNLDFVSYILLIYRMI